MDASVWIIAACGILLAAVIILVVAVVRLTARNAGLQGELKAQKLVEEEREKSFQNQRKQMEDSFKLLSAESSASLRRQNADSLEELLKPLQEKFSGFEKSVKESSEKSVAQDASMKQLLDTVMKQSQSIGNEARNLANALTNRSKIQGNFGEMILVDILRQSGLEEGIHFRTQDVLRDARGHEIKSESGATMLPDVIVCYPDGSEVVIDSKVSLTAYTAYIAAETVEERRRLAREHVASVTAHVEELKNKDYASYIPDPKRKIDYNIMFIPTEGAFRLMLEEAPTLWQKAKDSKVLIVSQMNLIVVLNMILVGWRQHDQEKNIEEVYKTAGELMSQLRNWMESFVKVGRALENARDSYKESKRVLSESNQSVIKKIEKMEKMRVGPKRSAGRIKPGGRQAYGQESIIPSELSNGLQYEEDPDPDADTA